MMNGYSSTQELPRPENLGQLSVRALESGKTALYKSVNFTLFACATGEINIDESIRVFLASTF